MVLASLTGFMGGPMVSASLTGFMGGLVVAASLGSFMVHHQAQVLVVSCVCSSYVAYFALCVDSDTLFVSLYCTLTDDCSTAFSSGVIIVIILYTYYNIMLHFYRAACNAEAVL